MFISFLAPFTIFQTEAREYIESGFLELKDRSIDIETVFGETTEVYQITLVDPDDVTYLDTVTYTVAYFNGFEITISVYMKGFDDEDPIECFNEYISDYE